MEISERLAKTFQFLKFITAAIQDHLDINIRHKQLVNPLQRNSFYYIDTSVLLGNIPLVKFINATSGTRVVYFP